MHPRFTVLVVALILGVPAVAAAQPTFALAERFDAGLDAWERVPLDRRQTIFATAPFAGDPALIVTSEDAAAALLRRIETPVPARATLEWRWRVAASLAGNDRERSREGDDYAARVFVVFGDEPFERGTRALVYVWAGQERPGSRYRSPVVEDVATIVLRSGDGDAGRWMRERRDLVSDYREAFGEDPPALTGVAVMSDTDDTDGTATVWLDDLDLRVWSRDR